MIHRTIMNKYLIIIALCLSISVAIAVTLSKLSFGSAHGNIFEVSQLDVDHFTVIEKALNIRIPRDSSIEKASLVGGKDWILYSKIIVLEELLDELIVSFEIPLRELSDKMVDGNTVKLEWWKIDSSEVQLAFEGTTSFTKIIIMKPFDGRSQIFIFTDGGSLGFDGKLYSLFEEEGGRLK